ncbi:BtpA/SgcQ family protein [Feifania hominis]|uniref:BtpA/SgcQ family protein n=1 Tax=Feifania hominis TaxID=2763660 RepID=A0A926HUB7_9FIRM|nr:BtpA/SgcQ family protein [Feifania hominis]MBC8535775.1 BtpA/SgcQ family protein [Feifania hominis]
MSWTKDVIGTEKPVIAMCHIRALPGDPFFDYEGGMEKVMEDARHDFLALQEGGVDAVMFSNEFSLPYLTKVKTETTCAMARIIGELKHEIKIPFGVNVLWDPYASLDLAAATGALFIREIWTGVYGSDFGLWNTCLGESIRHRNELGLEHVKLLFNIVPEAATFIEEKDIVDTAKSAVFAAHPDAFCVSGLTAGADTDTQLLYKVKEAVPDTLVFCNTGVKPHTVATQLTAADGCVTGTTFKVDGKFDNLVDPPRVKDFMNIVKEFRKSKGL